MLQQSLDVARRARRSARVIRTGARIYLRYKRTQRRVRKFDQASTDAAWGQAHERAAEDLYRLAIDLKGMLIKAGQFIGTRADLAPEAYVRSLSRLQDAVPPRPASVARQTIERELGTRIEDLFAEFSDTPIAAASLAQVHRARPHDGRAVAVKVQYPDVGALVRLDLRNLQLMARIIAWREPRFDYRAIAREFGTQMPLEVDFAREARMTTLVRQNLAELDNIVIPPVIEGLVAEKVVVTEFVEGERIIGPVTASLPQERRNELAGAVTAAFGHQILVDGVFQADPHPGNLLLVPDGRVALLDFGLTKELPNDIRLGFAHLVVAAAGRNPAKIAEAFEMLGVKARTSDPADFVMLTRLFFDPRDAANRAEFNQQRNDALARSPVEAIPGDLVLLGRVVGLLRGVCSSLGVPLSPMAMLRPYAERALAAEAEGQEKVVGSEAAY